MLSSVKDVPSTDSEVKSIASIGSMENITLKPKNGPFQDQQKLTKSCIIMLVNNILDFSMRNKRFIPS